MAEAEFDEIDGRHRSGRRAGPDGGSLQRLINAAGALTSVVLIVGLGVWAYNLAVRDVRGIPVIQALEGPARIAPEDPGGELAMHQGMSVNKIAADGTAGEAADTLTLAPKPDLLAEQDQPMGALGGASPEGASDFAALPSANPEMSGTTPAPTLAATPLSEPLPDGPVDAMETDGVTLPGADEPFVAPDVIAAEIPGVASSPRPATRPAVSPAVADESFDAMAEAAAAAVAEALAAPKSIDVAASSLPEGTRLVQIGAYPDEAEARLNWEKTAMRFGALLDGKRRVIEAAESGGSTFYRLRVEGFTDLDDARRFCATLKADNVECVPAVVR